MEFKKFTAYDVCTAEPALYDAIHKHQVFTKEVEKKDRTHGTITAVSIQQTSGNMIHSIKQQKQTKVSQSNISPEISPVLDTSSSSQIVQHDMPMI